jgi:hypothetical protein
VPELGFGELALVVDGTQPKNSPNDSNADPTKSALVKLLAQYLLLMVIE